ncbi:MAG: hypothetical protein Q9165_007535 [Trypethelium subeluteriae]
MEDSTQQQLSMIVMMGVTGAGKSYFINKLEGRNIVEEGADLNSCTQKCALVPVQIGQSKVLVIDTPGFDDTKRSDSEILDEIARILACQYQLGVQLKGVVYMHRITDLRYGNSAVKTFEICKRICGEDALKNVLLVNSRWDQVDEVTGAKREKQLREEFWSYMFNRGSNIGRYHGSRESAQSLVSQLISKDSVTLELQKELVDQNKTLNQTTAGSFVNDDLEVFKKEREKELISLEKLKQDCENDRAMLRQYRKDVERESARVKAAQNQQRSLQKPVGSEVHEEIQKKKSKLSYVVPFIPTALSILGMFVDIPDGVTSLLTSWLFDSGMDPSFLSDLS